MENVETCPRGVSRISSKMVRKAEIGALSEPIEVTRKIGVSEDFVKAHIFLA
jgi:hypothetical protein